jgi:hypothetical protein
MKHQLLIALALAATLFPSVSLAEEEKKWTVETSIYMLAAGMSGDVTIKGVTTDLDVGFSDVMENLEFGAMGLVRVGYGRWALTTDVIFMALGASKGGFTGDIDQWIVEPALSYRVCRYFEPLVGVRYNSIRGEIRGPLGRTPTGTQDWVEPFIGATVSYPLCEKVSLNCRGDVGGFGAGAELTWQAFPHIHWELSERCSVQAGYRWVSTDYETGSGVNRFAYDVLSQGPQIGLTMKF